MKANDIQARLIREAVIPRGNSPEAFSAFIKAAFERMARVIREAKIVLE